MEKQMVFTFYALSFSDKVYIGQGYNGKPVKVEKTQREMW